MCIAGMVRGGSTMEGETISPDRILRTISDFSLTSVHRVQPYFKFALVIISLR